MMGKMIGLDTHLLLYGHQQGAFAQLNAGLLQTGSH